MTIRVIIPRVALFAASPAHGQEASTPSQAQEPAVREPSLRQELLARQQQDQDVRASYLRTLGDHGIRPQQGDPQFKDPELVKLVMEQTAKLAAIDRQNTARLEQIVDRYGWPGRALVGFEAADAAWLLVQHADANVAFQKRCLKLMQEAPKGDVKPKQIAYLTDRILVHEGKMQMYGTQAQGQGGVLKPLPIADEANVDRRRALAGMPPLAEYLKTLRQENDRLSGRQETPKESGGQARDSRRRKTSGFKPATS